MVKRLIATTIILFGLLFPVTTSVRSASAQSPQSCYKSNWLDVVMCYQINGPPGTWVNSFSGTLLNLSPGVRALNVTMLDPQGYQTGYHTVVTAGPNLPGCDNFQYWYIAVDQYLPAGRWTAWFHGYGGSAAYLVNYVES